MGFCGTCKSWCGFSGNECDNDNCSMTQKLIGLYGVDKIGEALKKVFIRDDKALDFRAKNIDKINKKEDKKESK